MTTEVRILLVEDSPLDAELEELELRRSGLEFKCLRVWTRKDFIRAIEDFIPDLIISDYSLPDMDGLTTLQIAKEFLPETPFLFVSGTIGEERAIESLKSGAIDYVVKDRLDGLAIKVRRALKEVGERSEKRHLEEQLRQAQKMEAIGRMAGGIAHDFNNLLTVIMGCGQLSLDGLSSDDPVRANIVQILKASERAASLTRQLLAFSRKQILAPVVMNLNHTVAEIEKMLRRVIGADIEFVTDLEGALGNVRADRGQIEQVIMNLAVNARDAMPDGGTLTIRTANVLLEESYVRQNPGAQPGLHVMLSVSDSGLGMDAETKLHLFEPFFTTKESGKGTGLGLSTVFGIITQSGGHIKVCSEPGQGATFNIYLPRVDQTIEGSISSRPLAALPRGSETVLIVEDSEAVRMLISGILEKEGYTTLLASDGMEGIDLAQTYEGPIHLLITDVVLPRLGGRELVHRMASIRPNTKIIYSSGYSDHTVSKDRKHYLQKPFKKDVLIRTVRDVLETDA